MIFSDLTDSVVSKRCRYGGTNRGGSQVEKLQEVVSVLKTVKLPQYMDHLAVISGEMRSVGQA